MSCAPSRSATRATSRSAPSASALEQQDRRARGLRLDEREKGPEPGGDRIFVACAKGAMSGDAEDDGDPSIGR